MQVPICKLWALGQPGGVGKICVIVCVMYDHVKAVRPNMSNGRGKMGLAVGVAAVVPPHRGGYNNSCRSSFGM